MDGQRLKGTHESKLVSAHHAHVNHCHSQVYLPAIEGHVPDKMVKAIAAFLDFCYLVHRPSINQDHLHAIQEALDCFHQHRKIFETTGVHKNGFSLPRQHAMVHYVSHIIAFGAPTGLCSSITESMHIRAVKKPWRRSSHNHPLLQILRTNARLSKLTTFDVCWSPEGCWT